MSLAGLSDDKLIQHTLSGTPEAFGELVERHQQRLYAGLLKMLGSPESAQEAAQEGFILAYQKLESFEGKSAFFTWLFRIAVNAALTEKRREKRLVRRTSNLTCASLDPSDHRDGADPSRPMEQQETQFLVQSALDTLGDEFRTVLILKEIEGYRYEDIAEIVGIPLGTVRSRIHRARQELREKLKLVMRVSD